MSEHYDFVVVGGGIVGAAAAFHLARHGRVCVLEQESAVGYHSTGRSAALFTQNYGTPLIRRLTVLAREFLKCPPQGFVDHELLVPRGMMYVGGREHASELAQALDDGQSVVPGIHRLTQREVLELCPVLKPDVAYGGVFEPDAMDIDVDALLQGYLRGMRRAGGTLVTNAPLVKIARSGSNWKLLAAGRGYETPVLVNAAGAWCDVIAERAGVASIGLVPKRRTAITLDPPSGTDIHRWPMVHHIDDSFYFKPEAGRILACPVDTTPNIPCDVQPDEYDVALIADRMEQATTLKVDRIVRKWAGLRSFVSDGDPVIGEEPTAPGFIWAAGLGGYGVMTSPAVGSVIASLVVSGAAPGGAGLDVEGLSPARLRGRAPAVKKQ
jgi:D-arginine dehydrogenase